MGANTNSDTRVALDAVRRIVQSLHESSKSAERHVGVSGAQLFVLQRLAESPAASINELAERTHTHQSSASVVVTRLVQRGLVKRAQGADDLRRRELSLTAAGKRLVNRAPDAVQDRLIAAVDALPRQKRAILAGALTDLAQAVAGARRAQMFFEAER
jgi:DNA-binding MarR family transcriptional regulator